MNFGRIEYICLHENGNGKAATRLLRLTLIGQGDDEVLVRYGVSVLRHRRIVRITNEAAEQGCLLSSEDLCSLLFTSLSTIKRDISVLSTRGIKVPIRKKRKQKSPRALLGKDELNLSMTSVNGNDRNG